MRYDIVIHGKQRISVSVQFVKGTSPRSDDLKMKLACIMFPRLRYIRIHIRNKGAEDNFRPGRPVDIKPTDKRYRQSVKQQAGITTAGQDGLSLCGNRGSPQHRSAQQAIRPGTHDCRCQHPWLQPRKHFERSQKNVFLQSTRETGAQDRITSDRRRNHHSAESHPFPAFMLCRKFRKRGLILPLRTFRAPGLCGCFAFCSSPLP